MFEDQVFLDATAAFAAIRDAATAENKAAHARITATVEFATLCEQEDQARWDPADPQWVDAGSGADTELCMLLGISPVAAARDRALGHALANRHRILDAAFAAGALPLNKVRVIADLLAELDPSLADAIEPAAVAAARYKAPAALGRHLMALLIHANPDEAARLRQRREQHSRKIDITPSTHAMATLLAKLTAVEGREAAAAIDAMAATVCDHDPRTLDTNTLRTDAFMAILRGQRQLDCRCDREEHCPYAFYQAPDRTTTTVVHLHVNPETLLGLVDDPANLTGHGPIDPDLARDLAKDGTWHIVIDYARTVRNARTTADTRTDANTDTTGAGASEAAATDTVTDTAGARVRPDAGAAAGADAATATADGRTGNTTQNNRADDGPADDRHDTTTDATEADAHDTISDHTVTRDGHDATGTAADGRTDDVTRDNPAGNGPAEDRHDTTTDATARDAHDTTTDHADDGDRHDAARGDGDPDAAAETRNDTTRSDTTDTTGSEADPDPRTDPTTDLDPAKPAASDPATAVAVRRPGLLPAGYVKPGRRYSINELWGYHPLGPIDPVTGIDDRVAEVLARIAADPSLLHNDGHGGHTEPPPGALIYRPRKAVRDQVMPRYATCTAPGCPVPWWKCEYDHAVEFDHTNPLAGGWTIPENGGPACKFHNLAKAAGMFRVVILDDGAVVWISRHGIIGVTLPTDLNTGGETPPSTPKATPEPDWEPPEPPADEPIYEPTWWETVMGPDDRPPSPADIAAITDPAHRADCEQLRTRYRDHLGILAARQRHAYVPF